ncbi:hypothetical protein PG999_006955 [Apiospora kogelbergensis]|uniref:Uncharacterized protein n=2 Tax=Apiospora kogelbergensis TaxID=1337665 RepID=A0AAW0QWY2_9PEZI
MTYTQARANRGRLKYQKGRIAETTTRPRQDRDYAQRPASIPPEKRHAASPQSELAAMHGAGCPIPILLLSRAKVVAVSIRSPQNGRALPRMVKDNQQQGGAQRRDMTLSQ